MSAVVAVGHVVEAAGALPAAIPSPPQHTWYLGPFPLRAYALALATGENENGKKMRESLEKKMTAEQLGQAKKEFERLKAGPPPKPDDKPVTLPAAATGGKSADGSKKP